MDVERLTWLCFSFDGRIGRRDFWLFTLPVSVIGVLVGLLSREGSRLELALQLGLLWPALAVQAKRWHDRDMSGWWVLINFIPVIGQLIALVENGFLSGTKGENHYGPDPLLEAARLSR